MAFIGAILSLLVERCPKDREGFLIKPD